jgi:hypothetical protein
VIRNATPVASCLEHQTELITDPGLTLELAERGRPEHRLAGALVGVRLG